MRLNGNNELVLCDAAMMQLVETALVGVFVGNPKVKFIIKTGNEYRVGLDHAALEETK